MHDGKDKAKVMAYYDDKAGGYFRNYGKVEGEYPANQIRLDMVLNLLKKQGAKRVLDVGCGSGIPLTEFLKNGFSAEGFDYSEKMVAEAKKTLSKNGFSESCAFVGDLESPASLPERKYDAITALGVFPHNLDDAKALGNIKAHLEPDGRTYIEFRNELFSAFTLNRYSRQFFEEKLVDVDAWPAPIRDAVKTALGTAMHLERPKSPEKGLQYSDILARFHNPLDIGRTLFAPNGFDVEKVYFYHYHALPPYFEPDYPGEFLEKSLAMENPEDWRGYLMASAFVVQARRSG